MNANEMDNLVGFELSDDMLDGVAGGRLSAKKKSELDNVIRIAKSNRWGLSRLIEYMQNKCSTPGLQEYLEEATTYICDNWN